MITIYFADCVETEKYSIMFFSLLTCIVRIENKGSGFVREFSPGTEFFRKFFSLLNVISLARDSHERILIFREIDDLVKNVFRNLI